MADNVARNRIDLLLDEASFVEKARLFGEGVISGYGTVDGRLVFLYALDSAVFSGAISYENSKKIANLYDDARAMEAPVIALLDTSGVRIDESFRAVEGLGKIVKKISEYKYDVLTYMGVFSDISGVTSLLVNASDFSVKLKDRDVSLAAKGLLNSSLDLASVNGTVDLLVDSEKELIDFIKDMLGIMPSKKGKKPIIFDTKDDLNRILTQTDMKNISAFILDLFDDENVKELKKGFSEDIYTYLGTIGGILCSVVVTSSNHDCISYDGVRKISYFVRKSDLLGIPVLTIVDSLGFDSSLDFEKANFSREVLDMLEAYMEARVPKITLYAGKCIGSAYFALASKHIGSDFVLAFEDARLGILEPEIAVRLFYKDEIEENYKDKNYIKNLIKKYEDEHMNVTSVARLGYVDDVIYKEAARKRVISLLDMLYSKRSF